MAYTLVLEDLAIADIAKLKKAGGKAVEAKIVRLLSELMEHPRTGTGQVEQLRGNLSAYWSRRIDLKNRLIYTIEDETVTVLVVSAMGHYGDK